MNSRERRYDRRMVAEGHAAPDFTLVSDTGEEVTLSGFRGRPVVLYFYPKDDTSGCTAQACGIRDVWQELQDKGAVVLGVSPDSLRTHTKFRISFLDGKALLRIQRTH